MYQFKPLEWHKYQDIDGLYSAPENLKWRYSIIVHEKGRVEFALLDQYFEYAADSPQFCTSILSAQEMAVEHYVSLLKNFVL